MLRLKNRAVTRDIDFMSSDEEFTEVFAAKHEATKELETYPGNWLNANMLQVARVNGKADSDRLFRNSVELNEIIHKSDALVVYVADWRFQLIVEIQRCCLSKHSNDPAHSRHLSDAIYILELLVTRKGGPLSIAMVRTWYAASALLSIEDFAYVDGHYREHFGTQSGFTA